MGGYPQAMSRHAYGHVWHQQPMRPTHAGTSTGEAHPKKHPAPGHGVFRGVPGDVPPMKLQHYTKEGQASVYTAGASSLPLPGKKLLWTKPAPVLATLPASGDGLSGSASAPSLHYMYQTRVEPRPGSRERSHQFLHHGRSQRLPDSLRAGGVATFDFRRFHETNSAVPLT